MRAMGCVRSFVPALVMVRMPPPPSPNSSACWTSSMRTHFSFPSIALSVSAICVSSSRSRCATFESPSVAWFCTTAQASPKRRACRVSVAWRGSGEAVTTIVVLELPPSAEESSSVSLESWYLDSARLQSASLPFIMHAFMRALET